MTVIFLRKGVACLLIFVGMALSFFITKTDSNTHIPRTEQIIVLDAGHGGIDSGVTGVNSNVKESDLNLEIVKILKKNFENAGFKVVLTRSSKEGLYGSVTARFKKEDFAKRKQIIESSDAVLVLSIHQNFYTSPSRRGSQVFFNAGKESSRLLAEAMQDTLNRGINTPHNGRAYSALAGDYYILRCSDIPSVIIECGFLSNPADDALLNTEAFREEVAYYILSGSVSYLIKNK